MLNFSQDFGVNKLQALCMSDDKHFSFVEDLLNANLDKQLSLQHVIKQPLHSALIHFLHRRGYLNLG